MESPYKQEESVLLLLHNSLDACFKYFHSGITSSDESLPKPSVGLAKDLLETLLALFQLGLDTKDDQQRRFIVTASIDRKSGVIDVLTFLALQPLSYEPEVLDRGESLSDAFSLLKQQAFLCIKNLVLLAAADEAGGFAARCVDVLIELDLPRLILQGPLTHGDYTQERLRVLACEVLFAFTFRLPMASQSLIASNSITVISSLLRDEPSPTVKLFLCSVLRSVGTELPEQTLEAVQDLPLQLLATARNREELDDIRAMSAELLGAFSRCPTGSQALFKNSVLSDIVMMLCLALEDPSLSAPVAESFLRLAEILSISTILSGVETFFELALNAQLHRIISQNLRRPSEEVNVVAAASRTLRHLVQWTPPTLSLNNNIITHFPTLSLILKTLLDADNDKTEGGDNDATLHHQILSVELAITVSLLFAQSPFARQHINHELSRYPSWASSLQAAVTRFLNAPTLEYYAAIEIVDVTGMRINALNAVQWSPSGKPLKSSIRALFEEQTKRVEERRLAPQAPLPKLSQQEVIARSKLTFVLLNFAVQIALSEHYEGTLVPAPDLPIAEKSVAPQFPKGRPANDPTVLTRKEKEQMMIQYDKFDSAFSLAIRFSKYYSKKRNQHAATYLPTADGYMVRQTKMRNPWSKVVKKEAARSWSVEDVKEGDLFYFAIPFQELSLKTVDIVKARALRHLGLVKKNLVITPHRDNGRRSLLYDLQQFIMPGVLLLLKELSQYLGIHGNDKVRFPVFLFREREIHAGERALHAGNLPDVVAQVSYYFAQTTNGINAADPNVIRDIDSRIAELRAKILTGADGEISGIESDDDLRIPGMWHGGLYSDDDK